MRFAFVLIVLALQSIASACLWDSDTLRDERRGLPGIAELLAGRYERHSAFFYEDRVKESEARIKENPNDLAAWDDLAVAYEKLGQVDRAIETIERKAAIKPGEYTTEANWGTFLVHRGDYEAGLEHLREALRINPDAHFGREKYQLMAVEYLLEAKRDPLVFEFGSFIWPTIVATVHRDPYPRPWDDSDIIDRLRYASGKPDQATVDAAINGVVGMLRFGPGTSPHLYAALGDLLLARGDLHLAYRAFLRARDNGHPSAPWIDARLESCRGLSEARGFDETEIAAQRAAGEAWALAYQRFEDDLIRRGIEPTDAALAPFYAQHGGPQERLGWTPRELYALAYANFPRTVVITTLVLVIVAIVVAVIVVRGIIRRLIALARSRLSPSLKPAG